MCGRTCLDLNRISVYSPVNTEIHIHATVCDADILCSNFFIVLPVCVRGHTHIHVMLTEKMIIRKEKNTQIVSFFKF